MQLKMVFLISPNKRMEEIKKDLNERGFDVIISIGDPKENVVGSNCGQSILNLLLT
jgi:repressor of nif and glnA expression